ncbi:MAG: seryl-tRNA synthetase, partial [Gammaproteobacteria bacterium]
MLDIRIIRENPQAIAERLKIKRFNFDVEGFLSLDQARKEADTQSQNLLAERK